METTLTELNRSTGRAIAAVKAGESVILTSHGAELAMIVPLDLRPMSGKELAARMRRHHGAAAALAEMAENMKGLR
jgi:prevent-host-death family protein